MLRFIKKSSGKESDAELLQRYKSSGDLHWLSQLFERYVELVYGVCLKYLKQEQAAEDATMGIFESLVDKTLKHEIHNFKSWLHVLTKNYCLMQLRRNGKQREQTYAPEIMHSIDERHHYIEIAEQEEDNGLKNCLEQLAEMQRTCVEAFYLEGHTYKEIAAFHELAVGKVRSFIQNGRRNLRICMEKLTKETLKK
jgi:RNA polymerase sigma factor (sigma-70 family)